MVNFFSNHKYEILLTGLLQHLFIGIFLNDLAFYTRVIWPINMLILSLTCLGIFWKKGKKESYFLLSLFALVSIMPIALPYFQETRFMEFISIIYVIFFGVILYEVMRFLVRPGYINLDIISASACGYLLIIEMHVFLMSFLLYRNPESLGTIDLTNPATAYIDLVYYASIVQTTIGFGDISPKAHYTKLISALFGIVGQFYTVVLIGILLSKFSTPSQDT
ncbi:MAG: ion channel [Bacteroidota bacterium]